MRPCATRTPRRAQAVVPLETARARRTPIEWRAEDLPAPEFTGVRVLDDFPLATLREYIDWTPFFHTWGLKGIYPRILEHAEQGEQARQIFTEGNALLDRIIAENLLTARGVYGFFPRRLSATMLSSTRTTRAAAYFRASTSCASRRIAKAASPAARWPTSSRPKTPACPTTSAPSP